MRKALWMSEAVRAVIVAFGILFVLSVWPFRLWQRNIVEKGGGVRMEVSEQVDDGHDLIQDFIAQYDRLGAVDVYVDSVSSGRYLQLTVFDGNMTPMFHKYYDIGEETVPGRVRIPLGIDLEVGEPYRLLFMGCFSGYALGLQNIPDNGASPYMTSLYMGDAYTADWRLDMELVYRQPLDKRTSLLLILGIAALTVAAERIVRCAARRRGQMRERVVTAGGALRAAIAPVFAVCVLLLMALVILQRFDYRIADNAFYLLGLILSGGIGALFLLPGSDAAAFPKTEHNKITVVIEILQTAALAMAIQAACEYMNGLYDAAHVAAARREAVWLTVFFALFLIGGRKDGTAPVRIGLNAFGFAALLFFALLLVFRNGRLWSLTVAALFAGALVCFRFSRRRERWLFVLTAGLALHFGVSVLWCLTRRYFAAFVSARFPFIFHTVTVTAEYLAMMGAAAFVLLLIGVMRVPKGTGIGGLLFRVRAEALFFGTVSSYILFTASRTGILAVAVSVLVLLLVVARRGRGTDRERGSVGKGLFVAVLSVLCCFPAEFTLQRLLPPMVGRPVFMEIEDAAMELHGAVNWDNKYLIGIERFSSVFLQKTVGIGSGSYDYPEDRHNYDADGKPVYPLIGLNTGQNGAGEAEDTVSIGEEPLPLAAAPAEQSGVERMANGRLAIWRQYLSELNLTGHDGMGVVMPDGERMVHAHNVYLQVSYDNGMITGIAFLLLMAFSLVAGGVFGGMRNRETADATAFVPFALTVAFAAAGLTEWNFHPGNMMTVAMLVSWAPLCFGIKRK